MLITKNTIRQRQTPSMENFSLNGLILAKFQLKMVELFPRTNLRNDTLFHVQIILSSHHKAQVPECFKAGTCIWHREAVTLVYE